MILSSMVNSFPGAVGTVTWLSSIGGGIDEEADKKLDNEGIEARIVLERSMLEADEAADESADNGDEAPTTGDVK